MLAFLTHPIVLLTLGGAVGTNARYWLGAYIAHHSEEWFDQENSHLRGPLAIFLINVTGSLLLGIFVVPLRERLPHWWILLGVGFCGGYTTFSSFAVDTVELVRKHHQPGMAIVNVALSVLISCAVVWFAIATTEKLHPAPAIMAGEDSETRKEP